MRHARPEGDTARLARRDRLIVELVAGGELVADVATLTGLGAQQIRKIVGARRVARGVGVGSSPWPLRRVRCSCAALEALGALRTDRRRNGRLFCPRA